MADTILIQPVLSRTSTYVVLIAFMSRLKQSIHLCFGLPLLLLLLLPSGTILGVVSSRVKPPLSHLPVRLCDSIYLQSLTDLKMSRMVSILCGRMPIYTYWSPAHAVSLREFSSSARSPSRTSLGDSGLFEMTLTVQVLDDNFCNCKHVRGYLRSTVGISEYLLVITLRVYNVSINKQNA